MDLIQYRRSINQVNSIFQKIDKTLINMLPEKVVKYFEENCADDYNYQYDGSELADADLFPETKMILTALYQEYWCTEDEKVKLDDILNNNSEEKKNILNMKYDYKDIFRSDEVKEIIVTIPNKKIAKHKQSLLRRIINGIKKLFR